MPLQDSLGLTTAKKVMGTSSPIWTILLASTYHIFGDHAIVVPIMESNFTGLAVTLAGALALRLTQTKSTSEMMLRMVVASAISWVCLLQTSVAQMETPLAIALLLFGIYLVSDEDASGQINHRVNAGLAMIVLAAFTRLELGLFFLLATLFLLGNKKLKFKTMMYAGLAGIAGIAWQWQQFGTLVTNTIRAKSKAFGHVPFLYDLNALGLSRLRSVICLVLLCITFSQVIKKRPLQNTPFASYILLLGGFGLCALYLLFGALVFPWYVPLVTVPVTLGLILFIPDNFGRKAWGVAVVLLLFGAWSNARYGRHLVMQALFGHRPEDGLIDAQEARVHEYLKIGSILNDTCPNGILLTSEIGGLGYSFHGRVLDGLGLVTPAAVAYHPLRFPEDSPTRNGAAIPPRYAWDVMADLIVTYQIMGEVVIKQGPSLGYVDLVLPPFPAEDYVPADYYLGAMHVLVRKGGACSVQSVEESLQKGFGSS